jgi:hypothetical protein
LAVVYAVTLAFAGVAPARSTAVPKNTSAPTISGNPRVGSSLTAHNGTWSNAPTSFTYQWQRCDSAGASCADIAGASQQTYTLAAADADHTIRVNVSGVNADGQSTENSKTTFVVSSNSAPANTAPPTITGSARVGEELTASNGTWTGGTSSYSYQWRRCDGSGGNCGDATGATARTYGVRTADVGHTLRVIVTAKNSSSSASATSAATSVVSSSGTTTTVVKGNRAPTLAFLSFKVVGSRAFARFSLCDDSAKSVTVVERDTKAHVLTYTRRYSVVPVPCGSHSKQWIVPVRFRTRGRYTATLQAIDKSRASSRTVSRSITYK